MESLRILAAPGLRTVARSGWRARLTTALAVVASQPQLWLLGMIGFLLRGGVVLLLVPIIALPTQVEARLLIGDYLGSTGFTGTFWSLLAATAVLASVLIAAVLWVLARTEIGAFTRLMNDPETADQQAFEPARLSRRGRRWLMLRIFGIQVLTFVALAAGAAPLASAVGQMAFAEIVRPSSSASIYARVLAGVGEPLFFFLVALIVIEIVSALATRELLVGATGWRGRLASRRLWMLPAVGSALARPVVSPLRTLGTAAIGWAATAAVLIPSFWAITICWQAVRAAFLTSVGLSDTSEVVGMLLIALAFSGTFVLSIVVAGFASALRAALWNLERLR
ncbi:MAG: hypothetical protein ACR2H0_02120 [Candidatus Limnocylindrales bacterium]